MRTQIRIVSGILRGRKLTCHVHPQLRPTPDMVREALFSILGNAVPGRLFFDVFAGTGVVGIEALSRGARSVTFVERDVRTAAEIDAHLEEFGVEEQGTVIRMDVYRWVERWRPPSEPVNVFFSPPFADYTRRPEEFLAMIRELQGKIALDSVIVIQSERDVLREYDSFFVGWDVRKYGRNELMFWVREAEPTIVEGDGESSHERA